MFCAMILDNSAQVSLQASRSPFYEADLIVTVAVADPAIANATTREQVASALDQVRRFV